MDYSLFIFMGLQVLLQYVLGLVVLDTLCRSGRLRSPVSPVSDVPLPICWLTGLLVHLSGCLLLRGLGVSLVWAAMLPLLPALYGLWRLGIVGVRWQRTVSGWGRPELWFWILIQTCLGLSLFLVENGIHTPWINNYGDLAFHLGMIRQLLTGTEFPPEYHLFAGEPLSYPFFVNLWTVLLCWPFEGMEPLRWAFVMQWVLVWSALYGLLTRRGFWILPWVLLLGGGTYAALVTHPAAFSWELIDKGYPWTVWLGTVWVTQRSAMLGVLVCVAVSTLLLTEALARTSRFRIGLMAGLLLALSPLVHVHFFLVTAVFWGLVLLLQALRGMWTGRGHGNPPVRVWQTAQGLMLTGLVLGSLPALLFFPLLLGKSGMLGSMPGWYVPRQEASLANSAGMWLANAWPWFVAVIGWWRWSHAHAAFFVLFLMFLLGNAVSLAGWEWDQIKYFLALHTVWLVLWLRTFDALPADAPGMHVVPGSPVSGRRYFALGSVMMGVLLTGPGLLEVGRILTQPVRYEVYPERDLELAREIIRTTEPDAVLASPTRHNSAASLSGRRLYTGYPGTLASHQLDYLARDARNRNWTALLACRQEGLSFCPDYLIWDAQAQAYWGTQADRSGVGLVARTRFGDEILRLP